MGFFSAIRHLIEHISENARIVRLYRTSPEELKAIHAELCAILERRKEAGVDLFHQATGGALTSWAIMEERLVMVASILLKTSPKKAGLIFYSILNFQTWIAIITELFPLEPDFSDFRHRWNKIAERLRKEKDNRNWLAHNAVSSKDVLDNPTGMPVSKPSRIDMRAKSRSFPPMTFEQVHSFRSRIGQISDDLLQLVDDMLDHLHIVEQRASLEKSSEPARDQRPPYDSQ